jgi:hypothetical protein
MSLQVYWYFGGYAGFAIGLCSHHALMYRVICVLHNGEMLGESRLMMEESALKQGPAPIRNATVVASGHVVVLEISTEMARECFRGDVLEQLRGLGQKRQHMLQAANPEWLTAGLNISSRSPHTADKIEQFQVIVTITDVQLVHQNISLHTYTDQATTLQQYSDCNNQCDLRSTSNHGWAIAFEQRQCSLATCFGI